MCEDVRGEVDVVFVGGLDDGFFVVEVEDWGDGVEDFFVDEVYGGGDVVDDGWSEEVGIWNIVLVLIVC